MELDRIRSRAAARRRGTYLAGRIGKSLCFVQGDQNIANQAGSAFRSDLNTELQALVTNSQGNSAPGTTYRNQYWHDTTANVIKRRNAANAAWIVVGTLDEAFVLGRSSNTILGLSDIGKAIVATSSFTQTLTAAATLGDGWWVDYRVDSGVTVVLDPNSSENIDGAATKTVVGPAGGRIYCNGSAFFTAGLDTRPTLLAEVASTSGTSIDFTVPSGVKRITVMFSAVSMNGSASWLIQLGDAGGIETGSYVSGTQAGATVGSSTAGLLIANTVAGADSMSGCVALNLENSASFRWVSAGALCDTGTGTITSSAGIKATSQELTTVRITSVAGTATFDAGAISVSYG